MDASTAYDSFFQSGRQFIHVPVTLRQPLEVYMTVLAVVEDIPWLFLLSLDQFRWLGMFDSFCFLSLS